jgi:hypothetical protein
MDFLVFGDQFSHTAIIPKPTDTRPIVPKIGFNKRYDSYFELTGAPFAEETIRHAISDRSDWSVRFCSLAEHNPSSTHNSLIGIVDIYGYCDRDQLDAKKDKVLRRISRYCVDSKPPNESPSTSKDTPTLRSSVDHVSLAPRIGIFFDYNLDFHRLHIARSCQSAWSETASYKLDAAVIAVGDCLSAECIDDYIALRDVLLDRGKDVAPEKQTIVIVRLKSLQSAGVTISEDTTIEKVIEDTISHFGPEADPKRVPGKLKSLGEHLIIIMENVILYISGGSNFASAQFMPNFHRSRADYFIPNELGVYVAAIARYAFQSGVVCDRDLIQKAIRLAAVGYSHLFNTGLASDRDDLQKKGKTDEVDKWSPFRTLAQVLHPSRLKAGDEPGIIRKIIENRDAKSDMYLFSSMVFSLDAKAWKRTDQYKDQVRRLAEGDSVFHRVVKNGINSAFRDENLEPSELPQATIKCPYARFGDIKLVDDQEIAEFSNCGRIIRDYLNNKEWRKPLSIGVFGKPGIGKSFAVRQLVSRHRGKGDDKPLVFNLAQFDSVDQLTECFHTIQSAALSSKERPPLIMFDEFDSDFGTALGWLKYFLAPMQDGEFRGKTGTYKIGRAIFAFAGGTSYDFDGFRTRLSSEKNRKKDNGMKEITPESVKLPDFVSRLNGHLSLKDLDEYREGLKGRHVTLVRRAILIRTFLEEHQKAIFAEAAEGLGIANVDNAYINYLLKMPSYPSGSRSLETIIRGSTPINNQLVMASLPPSGQVRHHVGVLGGSSRRSARDDSSGGKASTK